MSKKARLSVLPYLIWIISFIVIPLALVFVFGLTDRNGTFTLDSVVLIVERNHLKALKLSLLLSLMSTLIYFLLAFPLAFILRDEKIGYMNFVVFIFILPMWVDFLLRTLARQTLFEKNGAINGILDVLYLPPIAIINVPTVIILSMVYNFPPLMVLLLYNTTCKIEDNMIEATRNLNVSLLQTLWCTWPFLSVPGIVSGITMVFVPALTTSVIPNVLDGGKTLLTGNVIETRLTKANNWSLDSGLPIVMLVFTLLSMTVLTHYDKNGEGATF